MNLEYLKNKTLCMHINIEHLTVTFKVLDNGILPY